MNLPANCIFTFFLLLVANGEAFDTASGSVSASASAKSKPARWIACSTTKELTRAVKAYIEPGDRVVELGSALRETSTAICETIGPNGQATLVDVKRSFPKREDVKRTTAMRREGDDAAFYTDRSKFIEIDAFPSWRSALFFNNKDCEVPCAPYDVLVADVSSIVGNDLDLQSVALVKEFLELNDTINDHDTCCRVVIVKSGSLSSWARRLVHAQRLISDNISPSVSSRLSQEKQGADDKVSNRFVPPIVVGTVGVEEYRRTISYTVKKGNAVIEVGCHLGTSTVDLHSAAFDESKGIGGCLGVDIGWKIIEGARQRHPTVPFEVADAWHAGQLARLGHLLPGSIARDCSGYDVVYVDVGGLSGSDGLLDSLSLINALGFALEPNTIVIKSQCIRRLAGNLVAFSQIWQNDEDLRKRIG